MIDENDQPSESSDSNESGESQHYPLHIRHDDGTFDKLVDVKGQMVDEDGAWKAFLGDDDRVIVWNETTHKQVEYDLQSAQRLARFPKLRLAAAAREDERNRGEGP